VSYPAPRLQFSHLISSESNQLGSLFDANGPALRSKVEEALRVWEDHKMEEDGKVGNDQT
jgi:hypothetical protein